MDLKRVAAFRRALQEMRRSPHGIKAQDLERFATKLGRKQANRGKEPAWIRQHDPHLSPPLSIPHHGTDLPPGTARSIINQLLADCDEWEQHLDQQENDDER